MSLVTVIIPLYRMANLLGEAIESVLKQTHATTLFAQIRRRFEREMSTKPEYACIERGLDIIDLAQGLGRHVRGHRKLPRAAGTQATCIG